MSSPDEEGPLDCPPAAESQSLEDVNVIKMAHKIAESVMQP